MGLAEGEGEWIGKALSTFMVEKIPCETNVDTSICQNSQNILHKNWNLGFPGGPVSLVQEDPPRHGATQPMCHNYWSLHTR